MSNGNAQNNNWWAGGVLYQIYPRSFQDSNGDGVGDLKGITQRLPYIASLGVEGIWVSPFFKSPMHDFGYDISDYCEVDPLFGTLADFDELVKAAHDLGLKVLIDLVLSHTSAEHSWFRESRASRDNPKSDWYVWADPQADGTPPNNWLSLFGGSAWHWDTRRQQYYLHNFLISQPDLNYHCPEVQQAALDTAEFWLKRGVDGFRLDVVNFYFHDIYLRSNPPQPPGQYAAAVPRANPYSKQMHLFDKTQPENLVFIEHLRALMDRYPGTTTIGEIGDDRQYDTLCQYTSQHRLHMAYTFNLLDDPCSPAYIHGVLSEFIAKTPGAWACWSLNNHDVTRVVTRWQMLGDGQRLAPVLLAMLGSLRGSPCLYQGEELGLPQATLPFEAIQDPYGKEMWPEFPGRDGCRTPFPWDPQLPHAGFTLAQTPWLPVPQEHFSHAVGLQEVDPQSTLNRYRHFLKWRKTQSALCNGGMSMLPAHDQAVAFLRHGLDGTVVCVFNLSPLPTKYEIAMDGSLIPLEGHGFNSTVEGLTISLPPHEAFFGYLVAQPVGTSGADSVERNTPCLEYNSAK